MENLLAIFTKVADAHNFLWYIDGGSLIGVIRGRALLPWDKDIDGSFDEFDEFRVADLEPEMARYGIRLVGNVFVWEEDAEKMETNREEEVVARMEVGPLLVTNPSGFMISDRLLQFFVSPESLQKIPNTPPLSFYDRVMWLLQRASAATKNNREDVVPLRRAPLRRFIPSSPEIKKKMLEQDEREEKERREYYATRGLSQPPPKDKNNLRYFEVDEDDVEKLERWEIQVPVPNHFVKSLEGMYGEGWRKEVKWKLDCYT